MYMRLTWAKLHPGQWESYEEKYARLIRTSPGLSARWLLRDTHDPDALFVLSHWDSLEALQSWEASDYFREVFVPGIQPMLAGEFTVSLCEVRHAEGAGENSINGGIAR